MVLVRHAHPPGALQVEPQSGELGPEPGEVSHVGTEAGRAAQLLVRGLRRPGQVGEGEDVLDLDWRGDLVQDPPGPLLAGGAGAELYPVAAGILQHSYQVRLTILPVNDYL